MREVLYTRLIHFKKEWFSLLFWLLLPIIATILIIQTTNAIQDNTKVPVGIVLEEDTEATDDLYKKIKKSPLIRPHLLTEREAINQLAKHKLDSVFVIKQGYEENIKKNNRNRLIQSYQSDLSFAYASVSEMIVSFVQEEISRSKAVQIVQALADEYDVQQVWTKDEIIKQSKEIQVQQNLLNTSFSFFNNGKANDQSNIPIFQTWNVWALLTILSTLLLSDWIIKESNLNTSIRFTFMRISFHRYMIRNLIIYSCLFIITNLLTLGAFAYFLNEPITLGLLLNLISFQLMINMGAFLFSLLFQNMYVFYSSSFALTLLFAIGSGALIPIDGLINRFSWIKIVNPLYPFLSRTYISIWIILFPLFIYIWFTRKEKSYVKSKESN